MTYGLALQRACLMRDQLHRRLTHLLSQPASGHAVLLYLLQRDPARFRSALVETPSLPAGLRWLSAGQVEHLGSKGIVPAQDLVWFTPHGPATLIQFGQRYLLGRTAGAAWVASQL